MPRQWTLIVGVVLAFVMSAVSAVPSYGQQTTAATVSRVIDGGTVEAQLDDGRLLTVRLIGIDTPEVGECGFSDATEGLRELVEGQAVTLVTDPTQAVVDQFGRSLFYVNRLSYGLDAGEEMLRLGWAQVLFAAGDFQRLAFYAEVEAGAADAGMGLWSHCDGDFHRTRAEELRERRRSATAFMRTFYRHVSNKRFARAWGMLHRRVRRQIGPFYQWKAGHRRSLGVSVRTARARLSSGRAVVSVSLRSRDQDACSGRVVSQYFRGHWLLAPRRDSWVAVRVRMRRTGGGSVRLSRSECPGNGGGRDDGGGGGGEVDCQGYTPCLRPGPDVDCAGGSGDGPRYVNGPVSVRGSDPYDLDRDGDGVGCDS